MSLQDLSTTLRSRLVLSKTVAAILMAIAVVAMFAVPASADSHAPSTDGVWGWWVIDPLAIVTVTYAKVSAAEARGEPHLHFLWKNLALTLLLSGVGFVILLSLMNNSFSDPARLRQVFGMTVLGTVSMVQSLRQQTWQFAKLSSFAGAFALLFVSYGLIMLTETRVGFKNIVPAKVIEDALAQVLALRDLI